MSAGTQAGGREMYLDKFIQASQAIANENVGGFQRAEQIINREAALMLLISELNRIEDPNLIHEERKRNIGMILSEHGIFRTLDYSPYKRIGVVFDIDGKPEDIVRLSDTGKPTIEPFTAQDRVNTIIGSGDTVTITAGVKPYTNAFEIMNELTQKAYRF